MYKKVSTDLNFVDREKQTEKFWEDNDIFRKSMRDREGNEIYMFYDGPPTANGKPHIGHVLTRVIKDMIPRYRTMKGYEVPRKAGWDTHGLPVELEVEKLLGLDGKDQIEKYGIEHPALIKKSDGATLYITRDLAAALYRKRTYDFAKAIYVVGNEQSAHFKQLKAVLKEMGYNWSDDMTHVAFGLVTKNGKKLSTRKGNVILLEPTIAEAVNRAQAQIEAKNPNLPNKEAIAHAVGVGAIKFYDLKTDRMNGYDFDLDAMVSFEGETGPYVQYGHARIQSILRKADFTPSADATYSLNDVESWEIIKLIQDFPRIINRASDNFEPSIVAKFAISLAQAFNKYYAHTRILDESPERDSRLALCYATATVLKEALRLLGVEAPDEM